MIDEFLEEISIMRLLSHPNIVKLVGAWKKGSELYVRLPRAPLHSLPQIAMELCSGGAASDLYQGRFRYYFLPRLTRLLVLEKPVPEPIIAYLVRETLKVRPPLSLRAEPAVRNRELGDRLLPR